VPPEDPQALADALARLLTDPALRHRLGDAARSKAQQRYGVDGVVQKLASLYEDLGAVATQTSDASQNGHGTKS